jgi:predicted kinase
MLTSTLVIFSGLPGAGKSTLADRLARELRWPILRIDDLIVDVPADADYHFWDEKILVLLKLAEAQLELGLSVVLDSVFMGLDRLHAQELAQTYQVAFRPVYCFVSDQALWERRVALRAEMLQNPAVATWERIKHQREHFHQWEQETALFVDAAQPLEQNYAAVRAYVTGHAGPISAMKIPDEGLTKGRYHV